jgi:hypothetical protein
MIYRKALNYGKLYVKRVLSPRAHIVTGFVLRVEGKEFTLKGVPWSAHLLRYQRLAAG